ncbi:hypothetical protein SUGI_0958810 [Cryptomeria japonica]|nr:hypothetical protein SUGI_0958810 [Cryptomeria japonica]
MDYATGVYADNSENISKTDDKIAEAQKIPDRLQDLAAKEEAFALPPMAAADLVMNKKTLVLDMDDTLLHASFHPDQRFDFAVEFQAEGKARKCYVLKRPGVENLLQELSGLYEIVIFTAGGSRYANALLDKLDPQGKIEHRLTRENCTELPGIPAIFVKDLSKLGRDLKKLIFVDDKPFQSFQSENAYPISPFVDDVSDTELFGLVDFCKRVAASTSDVRDEIREVAHAMSASCTGHLSDVDNARKKTLILGLEGVLLYSTLETPSRHDFTVDVYYNLFWKRTRYVLLRPGVDTLVAELAELFEIVVFSSDDEGFVDDVLYRLDPSHTLFPRCLRLFKRDYMLLHGRDCRDLSELGRDLSQIIFVDVAPRGCFQTPNLYPVSEFKDDMNDKTLFELTEFCKRVAHSTSDVRAEILFHFRPPLSATSVGWAECVSRSSGTNYYYNVVTKQTTWQKPPMLMSKKEYDALWEECTSRDGQKYYYNKITGESQWNAPPQSANSTDASTSDFKDDAELDGSMMTSSSTLDDFKTSMGGCDEVLKLSELELNDLFDDHLSLGEKGKEENRSLEIMEEINKEYIEEGNKEVNDVKGEGNQEENEDLGFMKEGYEQHNKEVNDKKDEGNEG